MSTPSRIAFVLPDLEGGGAQSVILTLCGSINRNAFHPFLLVPSGPMTMKNRLSPEVELIAGHSSRLRHGLPWLVRKIRELKPDVLVSVMGYLNLSLLAAKPLFPENTKIIVREANVVEATLQELPWYVRGLKPYSLYYPSADAIISPTLAIARELQTAIPRARNIIQVIPNPVDVAYFREQARVPKRVEGNGIRLVAAGRLRHQKGFDCLPEIVQQLPHDTRVDVFGDGPERGRLEAEISARNLEGRIVLRGYCNQLSSWIAGADALILPSRWEGLPNVVLESLSAGTPAIISAESGGEELAGAATLGAVSICSSIAEFVATIAEVKPLTGSLNSPRASLLPIDYERGRVSQIWADLLTRVQHGKRVTGDSPMHNAPTA
ncbi:MAG: glycosyltransferase [Pseudomonadota bacterium]